MSIELSSTLRAIADDLGRYDADNPIPAHLCPDLYAKLSLCAELAVAMELELTGFRRLEMDRQGRAFMEAEAAAAMTVRPVPRDGKILRPDFGRKP
ncbi:hypothetical protein BR10RB9215_C11539 [Brucella sp. 10RB9215]|uniref:hypothetical protein n=1 Tax=unclassified Brucella TaxID=2632610 RepID=UPI00084FB394|nr:MULTISPECIES: hypothetical protein [unclassified Brucella]OEI84665.1 hypothetical protein BA060_02210 [Brucella sp. B13-0095]QGA56323.1 hypothetical protein GHC20_04145 [Brucella sp. 2280]QMV26697.1 hypothetical protein GRI33_07070 [Brucella sp. BO3]SBW14701.1 hypothetical protein BR10RB9215_C11539 [Brucella sp. 10RB9215]